MDIAPVTFKPKEETYAITYASDVSADFFSASLNRIIAGGEIARIMITPLSSVSDTCLIQTGASGN